MAILIRTLLILLALTGAVLTGCTPASTREALARADSIMAAAPDSALAILDALDPATLNSDEKMARYALLRSQATHKAYLPLDNDSLIGLAVDYYTSSGDEVSLIKSFYYQGVTYSTLGNYEKAVKSAMHSRELARSIHADEWHARASELLADIMNHAYMWDEAIRYSSEAVRHYAIAGKERNHLFALCDLGTNYANSLSDEDRMHGIELIDSVLTLSSKCPGDTILMAYCYSALMPAYMELERYNDADSIFHALKKLEEYYPLQSLAYSGKSTIEFSNGNIEEALRFLLIADSLAVTSSDSATILCHYVDIYENIHDQTGIIKSLKKLLEIQNNTVTDRLRQPVSSAQRDYYHTKASEEKRRAEALKLILAIFISASILIIILLSFLHRQRMRIKEMELERRNDMVADLAEQMRLHLERNSELSIALNEQRDKISSLSEQMSAEHAGMIAMKDSVEMLLRSRWETLNTLCNSYFEKGDSSTTRHLIVNDIEAEIKKIRSNKSLRHIEYEVNRYMNGIVERLRNQCPRMKTEDITFITLIYAGFNPRTVCLLTDIKLKYFYNKRARLTERILASDAKDKEEFVDKMK